jgi:hypothetical protein
MDPSPSPGVRPPLPWWQELAAHLAAALATVAILVPGLALGPNTDFHAPFQYSQDALLILPFVKATVERGGHWRTERLGAPGIQELHDFPVVDHLHLAVIWMMGLFVRDPVVVFNLFSLLTYPLTTVTGMFVLRRFGLSLPASAAGGILYAFAPYHQLRWQTHYFLAAYYVVPLTLMVALWLCQGRLAFFRRDPDGTTRFTPRTWDTVWATLIAGATASAGAYYAFFGCAFLCVAGVYGWVVYSWRAAASAGLVTAVVVAGGVANHLPAFAYQAQFGANTKPTQRWAEESEMYGMKLSQLVLPIPGHNNVEVNGEIVVDIAGVRTRYFSILRPLQQFLETEWGPLGFVGAVGFVGLLAAAVLPAGRRWPVGPLAALTLFGTLFGTVGGAGDLFNLLVTPQIRCHNRISIYLAFLALFAVCWWLDRFFDRRTGWAAWLRWPAFAGLIAFGVWDQTDNTWFPMTRPTHEGYVGVHDVRAEVAERFWADHEFFGQVEARVPGGMVFCYPVIPYPETTPYEEPGSPGRVGTYDMVRGYLHTETVRWSFGAMKGREWDTWAREVGSKPVPAMIERLVRAGFDGLLVDSRGLNPKRFDRVLREVNETLGQGSDRVVDEAEELYFFNLRDYRQYLERTYGPDRFAATAAAERDHISWLWLKGFDSHEPVGYERRQRWCKASGLVVVVNPTDRPRRVRVGMGLHTWFDPAVPLHISGLWAETLTIDGEGETVTRDLAVPPGRHAIRFRCKPPGGYTFSDSRDLVFGVKDFSLQELP